MTHRSILFLVASTIALTGGATSAVKPTPVADVTRQIFISATDRSGAPVTDLTAADISIKEGGKDRPVESLKPATGPMHVAFLVDDAGSGAFQAAVAQFLDRTLARGQFSITLLNPQASMLVDFTNDPSALRDAVNRLGKRGRLRPAGFPPDGDQMLDAIERAAKALQQRKAERAVVVALTLVGGKPDSIQPDNVLESVRASGAMLNVVYLVGADLGMVMGDGPRHSGGRIEEAGNGNGIIPAAIRIADSLQTQYVVTYTIPDGTPLSDRIAVSTSRNGIKLTAPTRITAKLPAPVRAP
jgi:VWFA-related protein